MINMDPLTAAFLFSSLSGSKGLEDRLLPLYLISHIGPDQVARTSILPVMAQSSGGITPASAPVAPAPGTPTPVASAPTGNVFAQTGCVPAQICCVPAQTCCESAFSSSPWLYFLAGLIVGEEMDTKKFMGRLMQGFSKQNSSPTT
jgi:hypothetical protein